MVMVPIAKMLTNAGYFTIIHQKGEFLGRLFIQITLHQMIVTAMPLVRTLLVVTNASVMKEWVKYMVYCAL